MTRSPVALARKALEIAEKSLPAYSSRYSRQDFTQPPLFAMLVLMVFFKTDHRGIVAILREWSDLREVLQLQKVPDHSSLYKAQQRLLKKVLTSSLWTRYLARLEAASSSKTARKPASTRRASTRGRVPATMPGGPGKNVTNSAAGPS
jgi:hypothetical protein